MRAFVAACAVLVPLGAAAQTPTPEPASAEPTFRTGVNVVRVDVTVNARKGEPVADLTAEDFEVREDGLPQAIEALQFVRLTGRPPAGDDTSLQIRSPEHAAQEAAREDVRVLVIFADDYHLRFGALWDHQLKQLLRRFVREQMQPTDLFALMGPLTPISDLGFTRSKEAIVERIGSIEGRLGGFVPPRSVLEENQFLLSPVQRARVRAQITYTALKSLVIHLGGLREGRKSVLFVSEGPPTLSDQLSMFDHLQDVVRVANMNNVTIHTLDPRELGASYHSSVSNDVLAAETGGRRLGQSNDHTDGLRLVMSDTSAYYLLGYSPQREATDGKFHKIDVKVRRKGVRVLARKGYWAPGAQEMTSPPAPPAAPPEITGALTSQRLAERPQVARDAVNVGPVEQAVSLVTVACTPATNNAAARIAAMSVELMLDEHRVASTHHAQRSERERVWIARFHAVSGPHEIRLTAYDAAGETLDTWTRRFEVPEVSDAAGRIGTPVVYRPRTVAAYRALTAGATAEPEPDRRFRRTDRVVVGLPISPGAVASEIRAELVNGKGQTLMTLPVAATPDGTPRVELPLANLAQSAYVLRLVATIDGARASRLVPFAVIP